MNKSLFKSVSIILFAFGFVVCSAKSSCDSNETKDALAESIKQMVGNDAKINYDSFVKIPIESGDYMIYSGIVTKDTTFICKVDTTINLQNRVVFRDSIKYAPQYDYNKKIYIQIIEPNTISKDLLGNKIIAVNIARNDLNSAMKSIVATIFADNINIKQPKAPNPNNPNQMMEWGEWIMKVGKLNPKKWKAIDNGIYPIDKMGGAERFGEGICKCYDKNKELPILWINTKTATLHFNPSKLGGSFKLDYHEYNDFCAILKESYKENNIFKFLPNDDKIIHLDDN